MKNKFDIKFKELKEYWEGQEMRFLEFLDASDYHILDHLDISENEINSLPDGTYSKTLYGTYAHFFDELLEEGEEKYADGYGQNVIMHYETVGEWELEDGDIKISELIIRITKLETV